MSRFYCREDELRKLNKRYAGGKFECVVIYGRRRVGKRRPSSVMGKNNLVDSWPLQVLPAASGKR